MMFFDWKEARSANRNVYVHRPRQRGRDLLWIQVVLNWCLVLTPVMKARDRDAQELFRSIR